MEISSNDNVRTHSIQSHDGTIVYTRATTIIGNWKMHTTCHEAVALVESLLTLSHQSTKIDNNVVVGIAPPFTALGAVHTFLSNVPEPIDLVSPPLLISQNICDAPSGAHTGEISATQLKDVGVVGVIIGHSERRHIYLEGDMLINRKVLQACNQSLSSIICVGETLAERDAGKAEEVCIHQLTAALEGVPIQHMSRIMIAYEPVWAIGTGRTATPGDANQMHAVLRDAIARQYNPEIADATTILYGGSVKPENTRSLLQQQEIDGALVGGASLKGDSFVSIIENSI